jgi:hypothetical protein
MTPVQQAQLLNADTGEITTAQRALGAVTIVGIPLAAGYGIGSLVGFPRIGLLLGGVWGGLGFYFAGGFNK